MAKDSYWFRHDSSAGRGLRMRKMHHLHGHWGKGVYWDVIETLRDQEEYEHLCDESSLQMLASVIGCDANKFISWFNDCIRLDLLQSDGKYFFSKVLTENMENWETSKTNGSKGGRPRKNRNETKPITQTKPKQNPIDNLNETIREEEKREDKKRIDLTNLEFFCQSEISQENSIKAAKVYGLVFTKDQIKIEAEKFDALHQAQFPESDRAKWNQYFVYYFEKLKKEKKFTEPQTPSNQYTKEEKIARGMNPYFTSLG